MAEDLVTGAEFGRWRVDFQEFQRRLEERLDRGFEDMNERLDVLNGRTRTNSERIAVLDERTTVIATKGCARLDQHQALLLDPTPVVVRRWHEHPATKAGAGGLGLGAGIGAVIEVVKAFGNLFK